MSKDGRSGEMVQRRAPLLFLPTAPHPHFRQHNETGLPVQCVSTGPLRGHWFDAMASGAEDILMGGELHGLGVSPLHA